jgi:hypothetical protein
MFQGILGTSGSQSNRQQIDTIIANRISGTAGVSQLISYESVFTSATRAYSFTTQVQTIYSPSPVYITSTGVNKGSAPQMQFYLILNDQYISLL